MEYIGNKLKILRKALHLTQKEMGERLGMDQAVYQRYEANKRKTTPHWLIKKLKYQFSINIDWLYDLEDEMWDSSHLKEQGVSEEEANYDELPSTFEELKKYDLTDRERRIMNEAMHFSEHLKSTSLPLEAKRVLLQIFLQHIDQAIQERQQSDSQDPDPGENN